MAGIWSAPIKIPSIIQVTSEGFVDRSKLVAKLVAEADDVIVTWCHLPRRNGKASKRQSVLEPLGPANKHSSSTSTLVGSSTKTDVVQLVPFLSSPIKSPQNIEKIVRRSLTPPPFGDSGSPLVDLLPRLHEVLPSWSPTPTQSQMARLQPASGGHCRGYKMVLSGGCRPLLNSKQ